MKASLVLAALLCIGQAQGYSCPEYDVNFSGSDIEVIGHVSSWEDCGRSPQTHILKLNKGDQHLHNMQSIETYQI